MDFFELAAQRHSVRKYERGVSIPDAELKRIFEVTTLSPSSFNCQHWKFVVVREQERKTRLRGLSFDQAQVEECSAVVVVCGRLDGHADAGRIYADADPEVREKFVPMIEAVYRDQSQLQREEALRSGALAAMSLMYAAKNAGWDTGPMIGFDAGKVATYLELDAQTIPVMMVTLGKALDGAQPPRGYRRPVNEVVKLESMNGAGLA